ncbi:MAG: hypothetical protein GXP54_07175, partial [Deltaproteobacteria bacterium]|nr:hypothetical protein [Deltaproteobacteria bacterium]
TALAGSHTRVYAFDVKRLGEAMSELAGEHGADADTRKAAGRAGRALGRRFLLKIGNIRDYVVKLSGGRESVFKRALMSEIFGPVGYDFAPSTHKVHIDTREAVREIPYFAFGPPEDQFAPDVLEDVRRAVKGIQARTSPSNAVFLVEEGVRKVRHRVYDVLTDDPYFKEEARNFEELRSFQSFLRFNPLNTQIRDHLSAFFDAPMTVGLRDILRWTEGARHPELGWRQAEDLIRLCFRRFSTENFLPPEINYYTQSIERSPGEVKARMRGNINASKAFARLLVERMPLSWTMRKTDAELFDLADAILRLHFDYPIFEVEPYNGIVSTSGLRMTGRILMGLASHLAGIDMPDRRNPLDPELGGTSRPIARFMEGLTGDDRMEFIDIVNDMLWEVAVRGGIPLPDGGVAAYRRIERTFYSFQERAQYPIEKIGVVEDVLTLEEMQEGPGRDVFLRHPDLARKLVVFYTLVYRYFLDTGHVPDLRPDDAGRDLLLKGIWGYKTGNLLVVTGRDRRGRPINAIRFVDNKDQFKQYKREEDRAHPLGLAKYALRLVHPLIQPAMERSIGIFTGMVAEMEGLDTRIKRDIPTRLARAANQILREGVDGTMTHTNAFLHDLIDDATEGIQKHLGKL